MDQQTLASLRSMLTHPDATTRARDILDQEAARMLGDRLRGEHASARAGLLLSTNLGVAIAREILEVDALRDYTPEQLLGVLRPAVRALADPAGPHRGVGTRDP